MSALTRVTITIPEELLYAADAWASDEDRSRSWVIVEALRRGLHARSQGMSDAQLRGDAAASQVSGVMREPARAVSEPATTPYLSGLGPSRSAQLISDLALSPEERVRAAEETTQLAERIHGPQSLRLMIFRRYEDYLAWTRAKVTLR